MFEPKTILDKRMAMLEALTSQILNSRVDALEAPDPLAGLLIRMTSNHPDYDQLNRYVVAYNQRRQQELEFMRNLLERWAFLGHSYKDAEAKRIVGFSEITDGTAATRDWIEPILRANSGLLSCFGAGLHNPDPSLVGNDVEQYRQWLANLEDMDVVVSDVRQSSYLRDRVAGEADALGGIPILFINAGDYLHFVALTGRVVIQTIAVRQLPADWTWDVAGQWRLEVFSYIPNLTKREFLTQFLAALKLEERSVFYIPHDADNFTRTLITEVVEAAGFSTEDVTLVMPPEAVETDAAANDDVSEAPAEAEAAMVESLDDDTPPPAAA